MIDSLLRGIPYYILFIFLLLIYSKYNRILFLQRNTNDGLCQIYEKKRRRYLKWAYLLLFIFFGLRGYVYTDFMNYKPFFDLLDGFKNLPEVILLKGWEPGFVVYSALCKILVPNYFAWNIISTLIDLFLLYKVLEQYSNNHLLSLMVFFIIGSAALEFNVLRNAKAIFIFLYALRYIAERKIWKYSAAIGLACSFHISSILYFPLYFILNKRWPQWILWCIYIGGALIMFFHIGVISDIVSHLSFSGESRIDYLVTHLDNNVAYSSLFGNIERIVTMLLVILLYKRLVNNSVGNCMFVNMYVLVYAAFTICSESAVMVQRFQYMFIASFWILYPLLFEYAKRFKNQLVYFFVFVVMFMKLILIAGDPNLKYENILTGVSDFSERSSYTERNLGI